MALLDLVFQGGGAKGAAFVGALEVLAAAGHSHRRLIGTSAGAITATLLGAGYSAAELSQATAETLPGTTDPVFTTFMDAPKTNDFDSAEIANSQIMELLENAHVPGFASKEMLSLGMQLDLFREMFSFNECGGFYTGNAFLAWFRNKLQAKRLDPDLTWSQFAAKTGSDVSVVTSDVTEQEMLVLNERTAPQVPVALAVRMSMSIPFVWREMIWDSAWGMYRGRNKTGHTFVDGGVLSNFPLELVAESNPEIVEIMGNTDPNGAGTLGLMLDQNIAVPGAGNSQTPRPRLRTADRVTRLIDTMTGSSDAEIMRKYPNLICHLPVGGYGTTEFRMSQDRMNLLIGAGRTAMTAYLSQQRLR
ncbi:MAG: patatin-like phospholipase family protein [Candidatus Korobacteraceae bacterium]